ncbi:cation diffusion facilitator family transporter [Myxacorys almedinensis]|uniref:Cation diffusion facilitator family transporter n=1 Tax=Myxacorys almedinensis A TaxID=2690445 RepID=A0A8J7Z4I7_9CYAN|nr:cation diffusion facilitator family transporter [Myxacorys almedinensis]NDJ19859.1 cation diffusion facilitator family transporter [Myxacorys almedinensis A]
MPEVKHPRRVSRQVLLVTLWLTLLMLAVKVGAGWSTRSLSLLAESLHTMIDGFSAVLSVIALSSSNRPAGREIWGHGRLEAALALLLVGFLGFACLSLLGLAINQLMAAPNLILMPLVRMRFSLIIVLAVVFLASLGLAYVQRRLAKSLDSSLLRLSANQILRDAWVTLLVLMGLVGIWRGYYWLDPLMTIALVVMAATSCWRVLSWQLPLLVRQMAIAPEAIAQLVRQVQGVTHCYQIQSRGIVGRQVFVEMRLTIHPEFLAMSPWISEQIEGLIRECYGPVQVLIHVDDTNADPQHPLDAVRFNPSSRSADWN